MTATLARIGGGAIVWALHFAIVYGATAFACARGSGDARAIVIAATFVALAAGAALVAHAYPRRHAFADWMTATVAAMAMLAIAWEAAATLLAGSCR